MKKYLGTKLIEATPMTYFEFAKEKYGVVRDDAKDSDGYKVVYAPDGYTSFSPKDVFEEAYRPTDGLNFGLATEAAKKGFKLARRGWNGSGMHLEAQIPDKHSKMTHPYLFMTIPECEEGTRRLPWQPAQVDVFAEDWYIVEL